MGKLELLCDIKNILGEGPYYKNGVYSFLDIKGKKLYLFDGVLKTILFEEMISAAIPLNDSNGYLVFGETTIYLYRNSKIEEYKKINNIVKKGMRPNDAKADALGRVWFSTIMDDGSDPEGALYCLYNNEIKFIEETKLGNGIVFNKDNTKFFFADSAKHKVFSYDFNLEKGIISNPKVLFDVVDGVPDGMSMDINDNLFVAIWGGGRVEIRSSSNGFLTDTIKIPTKLVSSCTFNNDELIITTASIEKHDKYAGKVYKIKTKYKGKEEYSPSL